MPDAGERLRFRRPGELGSEILAALHAPGDPGCCAGDEDGIPALGIWPSFMESILEKKVSAEGLVAFSSTTSSAFC